MTLKHSALNTLTETMDSFKEKCDIYRPGNNTIRAHRVCMCLSRIDKPFKKSNNDKDELKLMNHARVLGQLGKSWISKYVPDQLYTRDLLDLKKHSSYIKKAKTISCLPDRPTT